jgi:hypothetical protein
MQLHNGALDLDSEAKVGTTFRFLLPLAVPEFQAEKTDTIDETVTPPQH